MGYHFLPSVLAMNLLNLLHLNVVGKVTIVVIIITDIKMFPLIWHLRLLNALSYVLPSQRAKPGPTPDCVFKPLVTTSHCSLSEIDFNWHSETPLPSPLHGVIPYCPLPSHSHGRPESNSTYYSDLDIARTHLICTLFSTGIDNARHHYGNGLLGVRKGSFTIKLGAVRCSFKREIRPYQRYEMWTRVLSWEGKWLYTITHFVRRKVNETGEERSIVCASAISKCVFKAGRRTIAPAVMLRASGLLPEGPWGRSLISVREGLDGRAPDEAVGVSQTIISEPDTVLQGDFLDWNGWTQSREEGKSPGQGTWTSEMIDNERRRGLRVVNEGDLENLEHDFLPDVELLGRHYDL